ncbi:unnamed protein product [Durusdinium trenchii]|uniref:Glutamate racemase n=2 Tax=Durusdinium trenchii TaxID=1381693 RepID=A0ABP0PI11_9DINO
MAPFSRVWLGASLGASSGPLEWVDVDLGEPMVGRAHHLRSAMRSAWKEVVDEMLDADAETSDEIVLTVRRQWAKQPQMPGDAPVGIFDSGVGGLTVYRRLRERWPMADVTYLADDQ